MRCTADYCDMVYHSLLTDEQDLELKRLQHRALSVIFGPKISGRKMGALADLSTLRQHCIDHCDGFVGKCLKNDRFSGWFPLNTNRRSSRTQTQNPKKYKESYARCERLRASPVFFFRRRLNGKPGKSYGARYREYRE